MVRRDHAAVALAALLLVACTSSPTLSQVFVPRLSAPSGVALDADGRLYIADYAGDAAIRVDPAGKAATVAGTGKPGYSSDGGPAAKASLSGPCSVAVGADGSLYIADRENNRIRKVDRAGVITTIAGNGKEGSSGDGGPAVKASLYLPMDVAPGADGCLYIADAGNHRVRKMDAEGTITTVAGNGQKGDSGDGGPATAAELNYPIGVAVAGDGTLYIADTSNHKVRKVDAAGIITTVAGSGQQGHSGDGGAATDSKLDSPGHLTLGGDGSLYIADMQNHRIRKVDPTGTITTVAGDGKARCSGDHGPATKASLYQPSGVALDGKGGLYIADYANRRVRKIDQQGVITTAVIDTTHKAPDFTVYMSDGRTIRLGELAGSPVVVRFWGTWCGYCRKEAPIVEKMYQTYQPKGVKFVSIAGGDTEEQVAKYLSKEGFHWPSAVDTEGAIAAKFKVRGYPTTVLIDGDGIITKVQVGMANEKTWVEMMEGLLPR